MSVSIQTLLKQIKDKVGDRKVYLYGASIRDILLSEKPKSFDFYIRVHHADKEKENVPINLPMYKNVRYTIGTSFEISEPFTINNLYVEVDDLLKNKPNIESFHNGFRDFNKKTVRFTKDSVEDMKPEWMLEAISISVDTGFHLDPRTINEIFKHRSMIAEIDRRKIYHFLSDSLKTIRPRRVISLMNTLGLSEELFGMKMCETSAVNHLKPSDSIELFTILFPSIPAADMSKFLVDKCGFFDRDTVHIVNLIKSLDDIDSDFKKGEDFEARKFLIGIGKKRIQNSIRLLNQMENKELAKAVKKQKNIVIGLEDLAVDKNIIKAAFGIVNETLLDKLINIAVSKVATDPDSNTRTKLLTYLNQERKNLS
jgi:tRNA nucleotidyltransferase/poly(A) polymerase